MIQRKQTLFLFFACILMVLMYFFPIVEMLGENGKLFFLDFLGIHPEKTPGQMLVSAFPITVIISMSAVLYLVTIFMYKKRMLQRRLGIFNILLQFGLVGLIFFYTNFTMPQNFKEIYFSFPVIFPLIAVILTILANRSIMKDEKLVRSYERIR